MNMGRSGNHRECKATPRKPPRLKAVESSFVYLLALCGYRFSPNHEGHKGTRRKIRRAFVDRLLPFVALCILSSLAAPKSAWAGGPHYVAGVSYFNSGTKGTPLTWSQGLINYYTDQGDLSPLLPAANADSFVADVAAVSATQAGHLAEDVNGTNVTVTNGVVDSLQQHRPHSRFGLFCGL